MSQPTRTTTHESPAPGLLALARRVITLKSVPRTGWLDRGVDRHVESVADHTLGVAFLAWTCAIERSAAGAALDPVRVLKLALLHDFAESETGDSPPYDPALVPELSLPAARRAFLDRRHVRDDIRDAQKRAAEDEAMQRILADLPSATRAELSSLWDELRAESSAEARFVKQADRLETFLQSRHYRESQPDLPVESFHREVIATIADPLLSAMRDATLDSNPSEGH